MENDAFLKKAEAQAKTFKSRGTKSPADLKRHDRVDRDERALMRDLNRRLGWSPARIGSFLDRTPSVVKKKIEISQSRRRNLVPSLVIAHRQNRVLTDRLDVARFASVSVSATGVEANGCWGWARVLPSGPFLPLHWRETPFKEEQTQASRIFIRPEKTAILDVAFALPYPQVKRISERKYPCREVPTFFEGLAQLRSPWRGEGCWLAQPSALENPDPRLEAYLAPGRYTIEVTVGCESGNGDSREFTLNSPAAWCELRIFD